jgi:hypothetical protein
MAILLAAGKIAEFEELGNPNFPLEQSLIEQRHFVVCQHFTYLLQASPLHLPPPGLSRRSSD